MRKLGMVRVAGVPIKGGVLRLQQRQEATTHKSFAIKGRAEVMGRVATGRNVGYVNYGPKGVLTIQW